MVEQIPYYKLKYILCYQEAFNSNNLLAMCKQMGTVVGCTVMRRSLQP